MLLIHITYEIVTEDSAVDGEAAERGFEVENAQYSFRELVEALRDKFTNESSSKSGCITDWFTTESEIDLHTGDYSSESIHYSRDNPARKEKYWLKAITAAKRWK